MCDVVVVAVVHESFLRKHFWQFFGKFTEQKMKNVIHVKVGIAAIQSFSLSSTIQSCLPQVCQIQLGTISNFWKSIDVLSRINFTQKLPKTITWKLHNTSKQQDSFEHNF